MGVAGYSIRLRVKNSSQLETARWLAPRRRSTGELRLFDTKGHGYRSTIGQRVIVSYEEQDSCGFFNQVDYIGRVVSIDPFDGLLVKFDVADASGDVLWVDDSDEWAWAM